MCFLIVFCTSCAILIKSKGKGTQYLIRAYGPELIPVSGQSARWWRSHKPGGRLLLLSPRPAVTSQAESVIVP